MDAQTTPTPTPTPTPTTDKFTIDIHMIAVNIIITNYYPLATLGGESRSKFERNIFSSSLHSGRVQYWNIEMEHDNVLVLVWSVSIVVVGAAEHG